VLSLSSENAGADRVEGAEHDAFDGLVGQQGLDPRLHLFCGFVGERHREDLPRADSLDRDEIGDPLREHPRLSGPRACHH